MISIIDYGMGNLRSVEKAVERLHYKAVILSDPKEIIKADKLILPGIGHFKKGMIHLKESGILESINELVLVKKKLILGICLGMQLFTKKSEEGNVNGLGYIDAFTKKLPDDENRILKIPHMGWNNFTYIKNGNNLTKRLNKDSMFYFVHSYFVECNIEDNILMKTKYTNEFVSAFQNENVYGTQFHPEKSHNAGLKLLKNFLDL